MIYGKTYVRNNIYTYIQTYIYIDTAHVLLVSVGLAQARPNYIEFMRLHHSTTSYTAIHGAAAILSGKNMFYNIHEVDVGHSQAVGAAGSPKLAQSTNCWVLTN